MTTAIIFVPDAVHISYASACLDYCKVMKYDVAGVVFGNLPAALGMLTGDDAGVLVAARPEHLELPLRTRAEPRIEFAVPPDEPGTRAAERRTQIIRPGGEG